MASGAGGVYPNALCGPDVLCPGQKLSNTGHNFAPSSPPRGWGAAAALAEEIGAAIIPDGTALWDKPPSPERP